MTQTKTRTWGGELSEELLSRLEASNFSLREGRGGERLGLGLSGLVLADTGRVYVIVCTEGHASHLPWTIQTAQRPKTVIPLKNRECPS